MWWWALLFTGSLVKANECRFEGMALADLMEGAEYQATEAATAPFPEPVFLKYQDRLGALPASKCRSAIVRSTVKTGHGQVYTVYFTDHERCDGGNTYGFIVEGTEPQINRVIATVEDSYIRCL